jgi:hypothetical protein
MAKAPGLVDAVLGGWKLSSVLFWRNRGSQLLQGFLAQADCQVIALCDVSGPMEPYSRALLMFVHSLLRSGRGVDIHLIPVSQSA